METVFVCLVLLVGGIGVLVGWRLCQNFKVSPLCESLASLAAEMNQDSILKRKHHETSVAHSIDKYRAKIHEQVASALGHNKQ